MVGSDDQAKNKNRYSFHQNTSTLSKPGVTSEFVHQFLINQLDGLLGKATQAASLKPDFTPNKVAIGELKECREILDSVINDKELTTSFTP